jgi:EAL and modified HD-GYP domain-containing signal transduction protein
MDLFLARQPIFDPDMRFFGYELLFRSGSVNSYDGDNADVASSQVMSTFFTLGVEKVVGYGRAFINFPRDLLVEERPLALPPKNRGY